MTKRFDKKSFLQIQTSLYKDGIYFKGIGGKALLKFKEYIEQLQATLPPDAEVTSDMGLDIAVQFIILSACDVKGRALFNSGDAEALANKDPNLLLDMANFAMPLSGLNPQLVNEVKSNLKNAPSDSSVID